MTSSFDDYNNNNLCSKNLNNIKKTLFNNNITNRKEFLNTLDNFYNKNDIPTQKKITLNKTLKENKSNNNIIENNESEENTNNNLSSLIKDINFNNLNEYYELQSSIFMKKIQKLNLKFYWTSEVLLNDKNIQYPYNKLFLILFKEISLYIDEIERLNKQLKLKTKNETYYTKKISELNQKEKNNLVNKQTIKNLQRNYNLLQKVNDKYKTSIDKLNKKLNYYTNTNKVNKNIIINVNNNECKSLFGNQTMVNTTIDSSNTRNSVNLNSSQNKKKISTRTFNKKNCVQNYELKDIIKNGIEQCDEELKNLGKIEELLLFKSKKKLKIHTKCNSRNKIKYNLLYSSLK